MQDIFGLDGLIYYPFHILFLHFLGFLRNCMFVENWDKLVTLPSQTFSASSMLFYYQDICDLHTSTTEIERGAIKNVKSFENVPASLQNKSCHLTLGNISLSIKTLKTKKLKFLLTIFMGSKKCVKIVLQENAEAALCGVSGYAVDCKHVFPLVE